jgi:hypothetical protein
MNNQKLQEKLAWQTAYQLRACPDDALLFSGKARKAPTMAAHLATCAFCNERLELNKDERSAFADFSQQMSKRLQQPVKTTPKAGQIWTLSAKSAGWGSRNRHYNPPRVLLLNAIEGSKGFIASQLFSEKALMGQSDVWLNNSFGFAEAWNTYSVHADMLESCWGEVSKSLLTDVCRAADKDWESSPEGSLLQSFRQIEVSVASFFSMQAVAQLAEEYEAVPEFVAQVKEALQKIKEFFVELSFGDIELLGQYALAGTTRGADEIAPETASRLAQLQAHDAIKLLPYGYGPVKGNRYILDFLNLSWLSEKPIPVHVTVRGLLVENVKWENWGTDATRLLLLLHNTVISEDKKQADRTFLSISWDESGLKIDILPKHS